MADGRRFPTEPLRSVRYRKRAVGGCGPYIDVTLDFEPAAEGVVFEVRDGVLADWEWPDDLPMFFAATEAGVRQELADHAGTVTAAVRVVLTDARAHIVDSSEYGFKIGGQYAVRAALAQAFGEPDDA
ncbi:hypothetical protein [Kitasatospora sp. NPDC051914]|uniref:hypothetical protein n=1 Tax=Kitasatospora sp. NPDC051914 TaxID=3154945 RepID=UPI0034219E54